MYFLCIDFGNSLTKLAIFRNDKIVHFEAQKIIEIKLLDHLVKKYGIEYSIISSVKSIKPGIKNYLRKHTIFKEMSVDLSIPLTIKYETPDSLGNDRLAAVCAAHRLYPHMNILVIGIGTCITYDILSNRKAYLGGSISPGLDMRLKAMHQFTSKLPLVAKNTEVGLLGKNTTNAMQSGALWGMKAEINGMIAYYQSKYSNLNIILSGGGAEYFKKRLKKPIFAHPNLVLLGLHYILSLNV